MNTATNTTAAVTTPNTAVLARISAGRDYTAAPACKLLATHCVCCRRKLLDAVSVQRGMGKDCYAESGLEVGNPEPRVDTDAVAAAFAALQTTGRREVTEKIELWLGMNPRDLSNSILHFVAANPEAPECLELLAIVRAAGFDRVADRATLNLPSYKLAAKALAAEAKAAAESVGEIHWSAVRSSNYGAPVSRWATTIHTKRNDRGTAAFKAYRAAVSACGGRYFPALNCNEIPATAGVKTRFVAALKAALPVGVTVKITSDQGELSVTGEGEVRAA